MQRLMEWDLLGGEKRLEGEGMSHSHHLFSHAQFSRWNHTAHGSMQMAPGTLVAATPL